MWDRVCLDYGVKCIEKADGGERVLRTNGSPACVAKNRFSLPTELPLSWAAFVENLNNPGK